MNRAIVAFITAVAFSTFAVPVQAGFLEGRVAYNAGDYTTALREWRPLAEQGYAPAQVSLGVMYAEGRGVLQDDTEAVRWYRLAATQGEALGQANLGFMYAEGRGVARDDTEAVRWLRLAAAQGYTLGQVDLGFMYYQGRGVAQDYAEAVRWFRLAAARGDPWGQTNLGYMYQHGRGVGQDNAEAVRWFRLAAAQGDPWGQNNLGFMYLNGRGVSQDDVRAFALLNIVMFRFILAADARAVVAMRLSPDALARAQELSRLWSEDPSLISVVLSREDRRRIQQALQDLGHHSGTIDGLFGPVTRGAIRQYQVSIGAQPTGSLTQAQAEALLSIMLP